MTESTTPECVTFDLIETFEGARAEEIADRLQSLDLNHLLPGLGFNLDTGLFSDYRGYGFPELDAFFQGIFDAPRSIISYERYLTRECLSKAGYWDRFLESAGLSMEAFEGFLRYQYAGSIAAMETSITEINALLRETPLDKEGLQEAYRQADYCLIKAPEMTQETPRGSSAERFADHFSARTGRATAGGHHEMAD